MSPYRDPSPPRPLTWRDPAWWHERATPSERIAAGAFLAVFYLSFSLVAVCVAHCQDRPTDAEVIARTFISEADWDREDDWASLGAVIRWRAETDETGLREAAERLSPRLHAVPCTVTTRLWRCDLSADLHRPRHLTGRWESERAGGLPSRRDRWVAALTAARALLAGLLPDSCLETPHAWGSWADVAMRIRNGERWDDAGCPGRNRYGRRLVRR